MTEDPARVLAVRAQLLATEHWSLLATRSQTWSEVMGRISAQFTFASASLVVLALTLQVVGLNDSFRILAVWLGISVLVTGTSTTARLGRHCRPWSRIRRANGASPIAPNASRPRSPCRRANAPDRRTAGAAAR